MEIGGYLGLEVFESKPYYPNLYALNLARTALVYLLEGLKCKSIFVPYYLCDSIGVACEQKGLEVLYYCLEDNLLPALNEELPKDAYLLLTNHYGQLTNDKIIVLKEKYERIIVDNTQSFFQRPVDGVPTFYSCRKFFGVSDGAYLYSNIELPPLKEQDESHDRMAHILGRFEGRAGDYYQAMLNTAASYTGADVKKMSRITANILGTINYEDVRKKRNENYRVLDSYLGTYNTLPFTTPDGPLAYPFFHPDAATIRKNLSSQRIYVPTYWSNVIENMGEDTIEYQYAANILVLPVDQRYSKTTMQTVADAVLKLLN